MKRKTFLFLLTVIVLCLASGCQSTIAQTQATGRTLTEEQAAEINTAQNLLKQYQTVTYAQLDYTGGNTKHMTFYTDSYGNICVVEEDNGYIGYRTDSFSFSRENGESAYFLNLTESNPASDYLFLVADSTFTTQTTDTSGNLVCETVLDIDAEYAEQLSSTWSVTTDDKMVTTTVFSADDYRVLSLDFSIRHPDSTEIQIADGVIVYDSEVLYPDAIQDYFDTPKYTVTVWMPDGSTKTVQIPQGKAFAWECYEGFALYSDANGSNPLASETVLVEQDTSLYVLKGNP